MRITLAPAAAPAPPLTTEGALTAALEAAMNREPPALHVCRERDVGLF